MASNIYSKKTLSHINYTFKEFKEDVAQSKEFRKEVSRIFSIANKRINQLDNNKLNSNAINRLDRLGIDKFALRGKSQTDIYKQYSQALAFLNNPTSTVSGAKEYIKYKSDEYNLPKETVNELIKNEQTSYDYVYLISNNEYYGVIKGYLSEEDILAEKGFDDDVNNYLIEIESNLENEHQLILTRLNQIIDEIPDEINLRLF